jgi:hypothetical protein
MKGYLAITILRWMIVRKNLANKVSPIIINHEDIHYAQERELWYIGFYLLYLLMFVLNLLTKWNWNRAYRAIPFEAEAYANERNLTYLENRERFAWYKYKGKEI